MPSLPAASAGSTGLRRGTAVLQTRTFPPPARCHQPRGLFQFPGNAGNQTQCPPQYCQHHGPHTHLTRVRCWARSTVGTATAPALAAEHCQLLLMLLGTNRGSLPNPAAGLRENNISEPSSSSPSTAETGQHGQTTLGERVGSARQTDRWTSRRHRYIKYVPRSGWDKSRRSRAPAPAEAVPGSHWGGSPAHTQHSPFRPLPAKTSVSGAMLLPSSATDTRVEPNACSSSVRTAKILSARAVRSHGHCSELQPIPTALGTETTRKSQITRHCCRKGPKTPRPRGKGEQAAQPRPRCSAERVASPPPAEQGSGALRY